MPLKFLDHFDHSERKQDKAHFNHLVEIANADGNIDEAEVKMLNRYGAKLGLTQTEIDELLLSGKQSSYVPPYELAKRFEQMYDVVRMVFADGEAGEEELKLASRIAVRSGFEDSDVPVLLSVLTEGIKNAQDEEELFAMYKKKKMGR